MLKKFFSEKIFCRYSTFKNGLQKSCSKPPITGQGGYLELIRKKLSKLASRTIFSLRVHFACEFYFSRLSADRFLRSFKKYPWLRPQVNNDWKTNPLPYSSSYTYRVNHVLRLAMDGTFWEESFENYWRSVTVIVISVFVD